MTMKQPVFKSQESRDRIRARYDEILGAFPFKKRYVETTFGRTFLLEAGNEDAPALILLHGSCSNSAFWFGEICALSGSFHVCAVDIPGEAGNSEENRLDLASDAYADWLRETLDALGIERAILAGNSLGSWMALRFAVTCPERVEKLVIIAPSGLSKQNAGVLEQAKRAKAKNEALTLGNGVVGGAHLPTEVEAFINLILSGYYPISEELPAFSDAQLGRLTMPVLYIAGENDEMVDQPGAAEQLKKQVPQAEIHLLEHTGHMVLNALDYIVPFLQTP